MTPCIPAYDVSFSSTDGSPLKGRFWTTPAPRAVLIVSHGIGEHAGCYSHIAEGLIGDDNPIDVLAFDFRGHGLSAGRRGVVRSYADLIADFQAAVSWVGRERPQLPRLVLGHSNGGQVALHAALAPDPGFRALALSNPALQLALSVPRWKIGLAGLLRRLAPGVTLGEPLNHALMTRDEASWPLRVADDLRHSRLSAPLFFGMVEGGREIWRRAPELTLPLLLILGEADPVIDPAFTRSFFERAGSAEKDLIAFPEMRHEPLNELGREKVLKSLSLWVKEQTARLSPCDKHPISHA